MRRVKETISATNKSEDWCILQSDGVHNLYGKCPNMRCAYGAGLVSCSHQTIGRLLVLHPRIPHSADRINDDDDEFEDWIDQVYGFMHHVNVPV